MEFQPLSGLAERVSALDLPLKSSDVVQSILALFEAPRYLEIGVQMGETFFPVTAPAKVAADPQFVFDVAADLRDRSGSKNPASERRAGYHRRR